MKQKTSNAPQCRFKLALIDFRRFCIDKGYVFNHMEHGQRYRQAQIYNYQTSNFDLHYPPDTSLPERMNRVDASRVYNERINIVWDKLGVKAHDRTHDRLVNQVREETDKMLKREMALLKAERAFDDR